MRRQRPRRAGRPQRRSTAAPTASRFRSWLADLLETFADRLADRLWPLLAVVNGWSAQPSSAPAREWLVAALRAQRGAR